MVLDIAIRSGISTLVQVGQSFLTTGKSRLAITILLGLVLKFARGSWLKTKSLVIT